MKPLKSVIVMQDILAHFILPFLTIDAGKVALLGNSVGLIEKGWSLKFLNTDCDITFLHLIGN